jgi:hypothetical protein
VFVSAESAIGDAEGEVFVKINGITHYLWPAVDQHGNVLDVFVQSRRNAKQPSGSSANRSRACGM